MKLIDKIVGCALALTVRGVVCLLKFFNKPYK